MPHTAHGTHRISIHGNVMFMHLEGTSNLEGMQALLQGMQAHRPRITAPTWAILADLSCWEGSTPDALAFGQQVQDWAASAGMTNLARIFSAAVLASMVDRNLADTPHHAMAQASFLTFKEAIAWLESRGVDCCAVSAFCQQAD